MNEKIMNMACIDVLKYENNTPELLGEFNMYTTNLEELWIEAVDKLPLPSYVLVKYAKIIEDEPVKQFEEYNGTTRDRNSQDVLNNSKTALACALIDDNIDWIKEKLNSTKIQKYTKHYGGYVNGRFELNINFYNEEPYPEWSYIKTENDVPRMQLNEDDQTILTLAEKYRIDFDQMEKVFMYWDRNDFSNFKKQLEDIRNSNKELNIINLLYDILQYIHQTDMELYYS